MTLFCPWTIGASQHKGHRQHDGKDHDAYLIRHHQYGHFGRIQSLYTGAQGRLIVEEALFTQTQKTLKTTSE